MRNDLKFFCEKWVNKGTAETTRKIEVSPCLFNPGEFVLIVEQSKEHPIWSGLPPVVTLRVFHTLTQNTITVNSNGDIARLQFLLAGLEEDFQIQYEDALLHRLLKAS